MVEDDFTYNIVLDPEDLTLICKKKKINPFLQI